MWSDPVLFTHSFLQLLSLFSTKAPFWTVPAKWYKIIWCVFHTCLCQAVIKRCAQNIVFILRFYLGSPGDANSLTLLVTQTVQLSWWCNLTLLVTQTVWLSRWHSQTLPVTRKVRLFWWQSDSPGNTKSLTRLGIEMSDSWWHCLTRLGAQTVWLAWPCWSQTSFYGHLAALSEVVTAISVRWSFVVIIWWSVILCRHHSL